ncbi:MAG: hypothetical protein A2514_11535 [Gammaproteobacteria bacterium RIFOXYD12_FULL_61_37]|nr:MAG: hypothetical protein A2514_11535 [Gammaproteobacteria bacterium RIFOXYD12_FULL_61_37]
MAYQSNARQNRDGEQQYRKEADYDRSVVDRALSEISGQYGRMLAAHGLSIDQEIAFLWAIFQGGLSLLEKACQEPEQLKRALLMQASIGLTLSPSRAFAYLVIRKFKLILDVGYRGLIKLAVDEGLVRTAKPELVHKGDQFEYRGPSTAPLHTNANFFGDRGPVVGGYVIATLPDGGVMVETMTEGEFVEISLLNKDSDAWKKEFSKGEMRKKTVLKRASKWWYNAAAGKDSERLAAAITYLNEEAGEGIPTGPIGLAEQPKPPAEPAVPADGQILASTKTRVEMILRRATKQGAFKPCEDYLREKFSGGELAWALAQLRQAEEVANSEPEPPPAEPEPEPSTGE